MHHHLLLRIRSGVVTPRYERGTHDAEVRIVVPVTSVVESSAADAAVISPRTILQIVLYRYEVLKLARRHLITLEALAGVPRDRYSSELILPSDSYRYESSLIYQITQTSISDFVHFLPGTVCCHDRLNTLLDGRLFSGCPFSFFRF